MSSVSSGLSQYISSYEVLISVVRPAIVGAILWGLWTALSRTRLDTNARVTAWLAVTIPLAAWLAAAWTLSTASAFVPTQPGSASPLPLAVVVPVLIGLFALTRSERIAEAVDAANPSWLIGLQAYRIFGGNFVVLWAFGAIPGVFALPAGLGDMLVGVLALPTAFYLASGAPGGRGAAIAWNVLGILDLVNALALGILSSPGPLHLLALDHPNTFITTYPTVMTPAFAVPLSLILHGISLCATAPPCAAAKSGSRGSIVTARMPRAASERPFFFWGRLKTVTASQNCRRP